MNITHKLTVIAFATGIATAPAAAGDYVSGAQLGLEMTDAQAEFRAQEEAIARRPYKRMRTRANARLYKGSYSGGHYVRQDSNAYAAGNTAEQNCDRSCRRGRVGVAIIGGIAAGIGGALGHGLANKLF